ncbi:16S rRNA (guanine(966)-N(2))-methyltransferase RsmD [[Limnothrix rosea] IAM M-220]|uniref:16S rRNA (guanine(966)-N(2))-methyltransferase RsmD n=1 Tax=[Limnothrix rosea] IAM M-220 TaxID=454133 RepID=UPI00095F2310|nr:16S rRNA (guanine(966)-N(2))-methyltransferase RsmD [[Limnothrix rosea] IAM M-220]OKH14660.1 16S rRNA (guanine(966)-N(2))-methyltransferase RsmD [[Limnothrix rosea] IAM M-220]
MRIYGNRQIKTLAGEQTRPTLAKVREAIFNIWQGQVQGCVWLDLCAGSGSMGAEALCRGAMKAVGIEKNPRGCRIINENWQKVTKEHQSFQVLKGDVLKRMEALGGDRFDLIYFDPPYAAKFYDAVLEKVIALDLLNPDGEMAVEYDPKLWQPIELEGLKKIKDKHYGKSAIAFYCRTNL